jgi:hypothetical protein
MANVMFECVYQGGATMPENDNHFVRKADVVTVGGSVIGM